MDEDRIVELFSNEFQNVREELGTELLSINRRLDAIVSRLDEQDIAQERMMNKVDRLGHAVRDSLAASEEALTGLTTLGKRVSNVENRGE